MRLGVISCLTVVPLAAALFSIGMNEPVQAKAHGKGHCKRTHKAKCGAAHECCAKCNDVVCTAAKSSDFKTLTSLLKKAGLVGVLEGKGPFTVFAPTDAAFNMLAKSNGLSEDPKLLAKVLKYHVVGRKLTAADLANLRSVTTLEGESLMINNKDGKVIVDGATVTQADINCGNGVIHGIDRVLMPERGK